METRIQFSKYMSSDSSIALLDEHCQFEKITCSWPRALVQDHGTCEKHCPLYGFRLAQEKSCLPGYLQLYCMAHVYTDHLKTPGQSDDDSENSSSYTEHVFVEFPCDEYDVERLIHIFDALALLNISLVSSVPMYLDNVMGEMWFYASEVNSYRYYGDESTLPVAVGICALARCIYFLSRNPEVSMKSLEYRASLIVGPDHRDILKEYSKRAYYLVFPPDSIDRTKHNRMPFAVKSSDKGANRSGPLTSKVAPAQDQDEDLSWEIPSAIEEFLDRDYSDSSDDDFSVGPSGTIMEEVD